MKKIFAYILVFAFGFISLDNLVYAEDFSDPTTEISIYPYTQTFKITAYYSPLEGQERYVTGSLHSDIRLNGSGVRSADNTPVYPGMIAAPKSYPFGMKMRIPGIGTVAVHDRGGAIVHAGERAQNYDRLDVWMGYGDEGLTRALNWGARIVEVTVLGIDPSINESVYLEGFSEAEKFIRSVIARPKLFTHDIWYGASGPDVERLQGFLIQLGYLDEQVTGIFGISTKQAILEFQIDFGIVDTIEDFGAGHFGPQTRLKIEAVWEKRSQTKLKKTSLGKGSLGDDVKILQEALNKLGYRVEVTGEYDDATIDAVYRFQLDHKVIKSETDPGSGFFGPKSFQVLVHRLITQDSDEFSKSYVEDTTNDDGLLTFDLQFGDQGPGVYKLQKELQALNFLRMEPTGFFGKITEHAVIKFQQYSSVSDSGVFDPTTRVELNEILAARTYTERLIAAKRGDILVATVEPASVKEEPVFVADLDPGDRSTNVNKLQLALKKLGYFNGIITTDYFGLNTQEALLAFQIDNQIVSSKDDIGAGRLGPSTRVKLNALL